MLINTANTQIVGFRPYLSAISPPTMAPINHPANIMEEDRLAMKVLPHTRLYCKQIRRETIFINIWHVMLYKLCNVMIHKKNYVTSRNATSCHVIMSYIQENMRGQRGTLPVIGLWYVIVIKVIYRLAHKRKCVFWDVRIKTKVS